MRVLAGVALSWEVHHLRRLAKGIDCCHSSCRPTTSSPSGAALAAPCAARETGVDYEIVVADDASTDATAAIAQDPGARVAHAEHRRFRHPQLGRKGPSGSASSSSMPTA
jgi:glycosyltransferase involved in cell wall biosynthesis